MALLDSILGGLKKAVPTAGTGVVGKAPFPDTLRRADFFTTSGVGAADFVLIGNFPVPPQQQISFGSGVLEKPDSLGGIAVDTAQNQGTDIDGVVRFTCTNRNRTAIDVVFQERTEKISENLTRPDLWIKVPERSIRDYPKLGRVPSQDDRIYFEYDFDTDTDTMSPSQSTMFVPITRYQ